MSLSVRELARRTTFREVLEMARFPWSEGQIARCFSVGMRWSKRVRFDKLLRYLISDLISEPTGK